MSKRPPVTIVIYRDGVELDRKLIQKDFFNVGRMGSSEVQLDDPSVGLSHLFVQLDEQGVITIRDMGSSTGTLLNGNKITEHTITQGDMIGVGPFVLTMTAGSAAPAPHKAAPTQASTMPSSGAQLVCGKCGRTNNAGSAFCNSCGSRLAAAQEHQPLSAIIASPQVSAPPARHEVLVKVKAGKEHKKGTAKKPKKKGGLVVTMVAIAAVGVAIPFFFIKGCTPKVSGEFSAGPKSALGKWSFVPNTCNSGQRQGFFGVWLFREGDKKNGVRVAYGAAGEPVVSIKIPGSDNKAMVLRSCKVLQVSVLRTNTTVNNIRLLKGSVEIDCPEADVKGKATFDNCH